jgi:hypothetical protein
MDGLFFGDARDYQLGPPPEPIFGGRRSLSSGLEEGGYLPRLGGTAKAP